MRGGFYGDLRYSLTDAISIGGELGFYSMSYEENGVKKQSVDIPIRGLLRFGQNQTFIELVGGYYIPLNSPFGGIEGGAKISLGGLFFGGYYTMGEYTFPRFEIGYQYSNLLSF